MNLLPGETYILKGVLVNKTDGTELRDEKGKKIIYRTTFIPEAPAGTVEMVFALDAQKLDGKSVVVFESLYDEEEHLIAKEEDLDNAEQTITYKKNENPPVSDKNNNEKSKPVSSIRKAPKTGVANHTFLWILTIGSLGIAVGVGIIIYRKKRD